MNFPSARRRTLAAMTTAALFVAGSAIAAPAAAQPAAPADTSSATPTLRVATYNLSLNRSAAGQLVADLSTGTNAQARAVAEIIQRTSPDVVLLNEFDYVAGDVAADLFRENYLEVSQNGAAPVEYPYAFVAPSNTGVPSGFDLNNDGTVGGPDDAFGFGFFEGQYGMAVLSKHPIATEDVRTFQNFLWKDMPGALLPDDLSDARARRLVHAPKNSTSCACRASRIGTCPSRSARPRSMCSPLTRLRPRSTGPRTVTGGAITTRSGSGRTTSRPPRAATSSTTQAAKAGSTVASRS